MEKKADRKSVRIRVSLCEAKKSPLDTFLLLRWEDGWAGPCCGQVVELQVLLLVL